METTLCLFILFSHSTDRSLPFFQVLYLVARKGCIKTRSTSAPFVSVTVKWIIGPGPVIRPTTSRSAVKRSIDWANPVVTHGLACSFFSKI